MHNLNAVLFWVLWVVRGAGIVILTIVAMGVLISEAAKNKLSPLKIIGVLGSAILAAIGFWMLPTMVNYARDDVQRVIPDQPIGRYQ